MSITVILNHCAPAYWFAVNSPQVCHGGLGEGHLLGCEGCEPQASLAVCLVKKLVKKPMMCLYNFSAFSVYCDIVQV